MDAQIWQRVRAIFEEAIDKAPAERSAFLDIACANAPELRREVEEMLGADSTERFEDIAAGIAAPDLVGALVEREREASRDEWAGQRLGPWRLLREIGRGGMGAVYLAERDDGEYRQQVAIKLMRPSWDSGEMLQRFRSERQILASLSHPNIARLIDGGMSADGKPYLVLEYVEGSAIGDYCDAQQLSLTQRLALFQSVCAAVAHAHRSLVVHRDLKPSNILVDHHGQVKLLDFGIAKLIQADAALTASATRMFTPEYAAPEQVRGEAVTTGVDVYALGLLLYQLLTGRRPYGSTGSTPAAYERAILTQEPQRPSRVVTLADDENQGLAQARKLDPASLSARLRGDLDAIVLRALRKEPEQRYGSVEAMSDDIERYLARRPVTASRGNRRYRAWRFLQRHAVSTSLAAVALLALIGGLGLALWQAEQVREERDRATAQADRAEQLSRFLVGAFAQADPFRRGGAEVSAKALLDAAVSRIEGDLNTEPQTRLALLRAMADAYAGLALPKDAQRLGEKILAQSRAEPNDPQLGADLLRLGRSIRESGQHALAVPLATEAMTWARAQANPDQKLIADILYLQAMTAYGMRERGRSEALFREMIAMFESNPTLDPPRYAEVRLMLSRQLASKGDFTTAEPMVQAAIADLRAATPVSETDLADAMDALGSLYDKMERRDEQVAVYREILPIVLKHLGPDHYHTAIVQYNLAQALEYKNENIEALGFSEKAVTTGLATVGDVHAFTTTARMARARLHCKVNGAATADPTDQAQLLALVLEKFPNFRARLIETRAHCGLPAVAELATK